MRPISVPAETDMTSPLLRDGDRILVPPLLLFALYLLMAGHNRPGGGFVAGLVVAAAVVLRAQARTVATALQMLPLPPVKLLALGLLLACAVAVAPLALGGGVLDQPFVEQTWPLFGTVKLTAAFAFDIGVATLVVGVVGGVLEAFGDTDPTGPADDLSQPGEPPEEVVTRAG